MDFQSGSFIQQSGYKAFQPNPINKPFRFDYTDLLPLIEQANLKLGELSAYSELVPDVDHFIKLHVVKEATVSSRIEGTQTNMEEAMLQENEIEPEKRNDWLEVNNYIKAMNESLANLEKIPLSSRLLRQAHALLLKNVRGEHKMPGEFRTSQNWIGGSGLRDAVFIPPIWQEVDPLMGDLENFLHNENTGLPHVIKIALAHYQFETIHPFLDGNGRIGRMMITLYFIHTGVMKKPVLYLSDFFERHRSSYYDNLTAVRTRNDLNTWLRFFLVGSIETSERAIQGLRKILELKKDCEINRIAQLGKRMKSAQLLMTKLFSTPIIRPDEVAKITNLSKVSAYKLIADFERLGILRELSGNQRYRIFAFHEYFTIFN
ncbi:MAG: Fic family protein [Cyclobacteriaceae bacterium]|nr:Fic family protein [Cyclobacteriaceae bacterium]